MIEFMDPDEAHEWATSQFEKHYHQASPEEIAALSYYKGQGSSVINRFLREAGCRKAWQNPPLGPVAIHVLHLDNFFGKCQFEVKNKSGIRDKFKVYRGHHDKNQEYLTAFDSGALTGKILSDFALWSTSLLEKEAIEFYDAFSKESFLIEIHVDPVGYGFYLDLVDNLKQCEILLPRQPLLLVEHTLLDSFGRRKIIGKVAF